MPRRAPVALTPVAESTRPHPRRRPYAWPLGGTRGRPGDAWASGVEAVDLGGIPLGDDGPLHLEGRREQAGVDGEVLRQDGERLIASALRHRLVGVVDGRLELGQQRRVLVDASRSARRSVWPCSAEPLRQHLGVDGEQRRDVGPAVADDEALAQQPVRPEPVLEHGRRDVLAAGGDDEVLLAAGDRQVALVVERAEVAACGTSRPSSKASRVASSLCQ